MALARDIAMLLARNDIHVAPVWIPTKANQHVDDLSRSRYRKIADANPQLRCPPSPRRARARPTRMVVQRLSFAQRGRTHSSVRFSTQTSGNIFKSNQILLHSLRAPWHSASLSSYLLLASDLDIATLHRTGQVQDYLVILHWREIRPHRHVIP